MHDVIKARERGKITLIAPLTQGLLFHHVSHLIPQSLKLQMYVLCTRRYMIVSFCLRQRDMDFVLFVAKRKGRDFVSDLVFIAGALLCCYCVVQVHYNFIVIRFCIPLSQLRVVFQLFHMS